MVTVAAVATTKIFPGVAKFMKAHMWLEIVAMVVGFVLLIFVLCAKKLRRKVPLNYILLFSFTIVWSYMVAGFTNWFSVDKILASAGLTLAMFIGLTVFSCAYDPSGPYIKGGVATAGCFALFPMIFFCYYIRSYPIWWNFIYFAIILLIALFILFDIRTIMTDLETDEYIIGAVILYVDTIMLFMQLLGAGGGD